MVRQMFSRVRVKDAGGTELSVGDVLGESDYTATNNAAKEEGLEPAKADPLVMGILDVSLSRASFLSAASFQNTTRMLIKAAVYGAKDTLEGLKENVIIGRLIPAGTGFPGSRKYEMVQRIAPAPAEIVEKTSITESA
jgi:DNA-directed RNA polymerase subunit beta'